VALLGECIECGACWFIIFVNIVNSSFALYDKTSRTCYFVHTHNRSLGLFSHLVAAVGSCELTKSRIGRG